jgi:hypothetical protein
MDQLSPAHLDWASSFLSIHIDVLVGGGPSATERCAAADGKLPAPMQPDCKIVHGKVPGPENHLLCTTHNHVVDVEAKTIIAHSLAEYMKAHPVHRQSHGAGHATSASKAPVSSAAAPNDAAAKTEVKPPEVPRTKIPVFTGNANEVLAQECALLDSMRPSRDDPEIYSAIVDGKEASIGKAQAEAILAKITKQMEINIGAIAEYNDSIITIYKSASAKGLEHIGSGLNKLVSFVKGDGWIHDPGDDLDALQRQWLTALSGARGDLAQRQFQSSARKMADGEIKGVQAEHLFKVFTSKTQRNADTTLSVLQHVESTSKFIAKTIATAEFGPAGGKAMDAVFAAADTAGEALAGHEIDWAGKVIDLGIGVLMDKFGGQAEAAIKDRVKALVESKLKGIAKDKAKEWSEKIAEKVAKKAVEKGSEFVKEELHKAADAAKGKKITYADLAKATVDSMSKPNAETTGKLEAAIANNPDFVKLAGGRRS